MSGVTGPGKDSPVSHTSTPKPGPSRELVGVSEAVAATGKSAMEQSTQMQKTQAITKHDVTQLPNANELPTATKAIDQVGKIFIANNTYRK